MSEPGEPGRAWTLVAEPRDAGVARQSATVDAALAKRCCGPLPCGYVRDEDMAAVQSDALVLAVPRYCCGAICQAWLWDVPPVGEPAPDATGSCGLVRAP